MQTLRRTGYNYKIYCHPVDAEMVTTLMNKVSEKAKSMGSNLVCGGVMDRRDRAQYGEDPQYATVYDVCFLYFYGPAYLYRNSTNTG